MNPLIILAVLGAGAYWYFSKFKTFLTNISAQITMLKFDSAKTLANSFVNIYINMNIQIDNKTNKATTLQSGIINLYFKNAFIGTINIENVPIKASTSTTFPVTLQIPTLKVFSSITTIVDAFKSGNYDLTFNLQGELKFPAGIVKVNETQTVKLI